MLSIQTNVNALQAADNVATTSTQLSSTIGQLSSGYRLDAASVDPAALGISEQLQADIGSYTQANQNAVDGQSIVNTATAALTQTSSILTSMRGLAMEAANTDINSSTAADVNVETEFGQLQGELDRINNDTAYNGLGLFSADAQGELAAPGAATATGLTFQFQVGIGSTSANDVIQVADTNMDVSAAGLGVGTLQSTALDATFNGGAGGAGTLDTTADAEGVLTAIDAAIQSVSTYQATLGSVSSRLGSAIQTIAAAGQSLTAANSGLQDTNVATTSAMFAQQQTLEQAGVAVLAQANQMPSLALKLLQ